MTNLSGIFYAGESRPTVVALHCSGGSGHAWRHLGQAIGDRFSLIAPDHIGCGAAQSWSGAHPFTLADEAALAIGVVDATETPVHLVGHSYGGAVALRVARARPSRIASLTLYEPTALWVLNTVGHDGKDALGEIASVAYDVTRAMQKGAYALAARQFVNYWGGEGSWEAMSREAQAGTVRYLPKSLLEYHALLHERAPLGVYRNFNFPVLIMRGERAAPAFQLIVRQLARAMKIASLHTIDGAGHMGPLSHAATVNAMILAHIASAEPGATMAQDKSAALGLAA